MHKIAGLTLAVATVSVVALSWAGPPPKDNPVKPPPKPAPTPIRPIRPLPAPSPIGTIKRPFVVARPLEFTNVRPSQAAPYASGPISYDLEIHNPASTPQSGTLKIKTHLDDPAEQTIAVEVPANAKKWVTFVDPRGLGDAACKSHYHRVDLGDARKLIMVRPSCTFTISPMVDPTRGYPADRLLSVRQGKLHYTSARLDRTTISCGTTLQVTARVRNGTTAPVSAKLSWGGKVLPTARAFTLAPGAETSVTTGLPFSGEVDRQSNRLGIEAPSGVPVLSSSFESYANLTRSCDLTTRLQWVAR